LQLIDGRAVVIDVGVVVDLPGCGIDKGGLLGAPIPHLICPVCVCLIPSVDGQPCCKLEKSSVRYQVLEVVAIVEGEDLPSEPSSAGVVIPLSRLEIEDGLGEGEPGRLISWGVRVLEFCGN
jgi:hypothetical protein